jgi:hypothetical protein
VQRLVGQGIGGVTSELGVWAPGSLLSHGGGVAAQAAVLPVSSWPKIALQPYGR